MATQAIDQAPAGAQAAPDAAAANAGGGKQALIIPGVAGLIAGLVVGLFALGPMLAARRAAAPPPKAAAEAPTSSAIHQVDNLVLNPAGTDGARFLMVTTTFEVKNGGVDQLMKDHDAEVRDRILGLLGRKTVDELSDISKRDVLKKEVLEGVSTLFPKGSILKVFFSQFVIQ